MDFQAIVTELKATIPFFSDLPSFEVKIMNNSSRTLGLASYRTKEQKMTVKIQKRISHDYEAVRKIIAHEMVHIWQFNQKYILKNNVETNHGKDFLRIADEVNAILGAGYVTIKAGPDVAKNAIYADKMTKVAVFASKNGDMLVAKASSSSKALRHMNYRVNTLGDVVVYMEIPVNEKFKMPILGQGRYVRMTREEIKAGIAA
jgi:predicted SprT family Zn-dependent metalloprotease